MLSLKKLVLVAASVALALSATTTAIDAQQHHINHVRIRVSTNVLSDDNVETKHAPVQSQHYRGPESPPPVTRYPESKPVVRPTPPPSDPDSPPPVTRYPEPKPVVRPTSPPTDPESPPPVTRPPQAPPQDACEKKGMTKVFVQGFTRYFFCVAGDACVGNQRGACPGAGRYRDLPNGSSCVKVGATYTCKAN